jgi:hypothetical protein
MSLRGQLGLLRGTGNSHYLGDKKPELSLKTETPGRGRSGRGTG